MKKLLSMFTAALLLVSILSFALAEPVIVNSGTCGENVTWTLDNTGLLTITGTGRMNPYKPWSNPFTGLAVTSLYVDEGVTFLHEISSLTYFWNDLAWIDVHPQNTVYSSADGVLFSKDGSTLLMYPAKKSGSVYQVPDGVSTIGNSAFRSAKYIEEVLFPDSVRLIEAFAFQSAGLHAITLNDGLKTIKNAVFMYSDLSDITIPASVEEIGPAAFAECSSLQDIQVAPSSSHFRSENGVLFNYFGETLLAYPGGRIEYYYVPDGTVTIASNSFYGSSVWGVCFPSSLKTIGEYAFCGCWHLGSIELPDSVTEIQTAAFMGCESASILRLSESLATIPDAAFAECEALTSVSIPASVTFIDRHAFRNCGTLSVSVPSAATDIYVNPNDQSENAFTGTDVHLLVMPGSAAEAAATACGLDYELIDSRSAPVFVPSSSLDSVRINEAILFRFEPRGVAYTAFSAEVYLNGELNYVNNFTPETFMEGGFYFGLSDYAPGHYSIRVCGYVDGVQSNWCDPFEFDPIVEKTIQRIDFTSPVPAQVSRGDITSLAWEDLPSGITEISLSLFRIEGENKTFYSSAWYGNQETQTEYIWNAPAGEYELRLYVNAGTGVYIVEQYQSRLVTILPSDKEWVAKDGVLLKYLGSDASVTIPAQVDGTPIRAVASKAFPSSSTKTVRTPANPLCDLTLLREAFNLRTVETIVLNGRVTVEQGALGFALGNVYAGPEVTFASLGNVSPNLVIYGYSGTDAERAAQDAHRSFVSLGSVETEATLSSTVGMAGYTIRAALTEEADAVYVKETGCEYPCDGLFAYIPTDSEQLTSLTIAKVNQGVRAAFAEPVSITVLPYGQVYHLPADIVLVEEGALAETPVRLLELPNENVVVEEIGDTLLAIGEHRYIVNPD